MTDTDLNEELRTRYLDKLVAANAATFKGAQDYTNFIIVGGYAGFFALWSGMAKDIPATFRLAAGACMGLSLIFFIGWELYGVQQRMQAGSRLSSVLAVNGYPPDFEDRWNKATALNARDSFHYMRVWPWIFGPAVILGLIGAATLTVSATIVFLTKLP